METIGNDLELLSPQQAAKRMKISPGTLKSLINNGEIGVIKLGKREKIPYRELDRYLEQNTVRSNRELANFLYTERKPSDILIGRKRSTESMGGDEILIDLLNEIDEK